MPEGASLCVTGGLLCGHLSIHLQIHSVGQDHVNGICWGSKSHTAEPEGQLCKGSSLLQSSKGRETQEAVVLNVPPSLIPPPAVSLF